MSSTSVGIIHKYNFDRARAEAMRLKKWLEERGVAVYSEEMNTTAPPNTCPEDPGGIPNSVDWVVVLGGDGTLLGAARKVGNFGVPILGVNLGGLGFLTSIPLERLYPVIELMLNHQLRIESRLMLETRVIRNGKEACRYLALNDVVINNAFAKIIDLNVYINEGFLTTFRADGLIVSTPTGSTAYNLSAGGPILYPTLTNFILTPICPFTLSNRPLILPDSDTIVIKMGMDHKEEVSLTLDGQLGFDLSPEDKVVICRSNTDIKLVKSPDQSYFEILRTKLMWGGITYKKDGDHKKDLPG